MRQSPGVSFQRMSVVLLVALVLAAVSLCAIAEQSFLSRTYVWEYAGRNWSLSFRFPSALYNAQRELARNLVYTAYDTYVTDPRDDEILGSFVEELERLAVGLNIWDRLNLVIALVQSLPYVAEMCEYPRYPLETLIDQRGDCEDAAILTAALVRELGFDVVLLAFLTEGHMALGIRVLPPDHSTLQAYEWNGDLYYYVEPTSPGWKIGQLPPSFHSEPVVIGLRTTYATAPSW